MVPMDQPEAALAMITKFTRGKPLVSDDDDDGDITTRRAGSSAAAAQQS